MTEDEAIQRLNALDSAVVASPRVNWPVLLVMILACLATGLIAITLPFARNASNTSDDLARNNEITGCRAAANADVVDARTNVDSINVELNLLDNRFNDAILNNNQAEIDAIRPLGAPLRQQLATATADYRVKNDAYQTAVRLSVENPAQFLSLCRRNTLVPERTTTTTVAATHNASAAPTTSTSLARTRRPRTTTTTIRPTTTTGSTTTSTVYPSTTEPSAGLCELLPLEVPCPL